LLDQLGLTEAALVGHSLPSGPPWWRAGGRASIVPHRSLVLIDPIGFWRDDAPVIELDADGLPELPERVFGTPTGRRRKDALLHPGRSWRTAARWRGRA